MPHPLPSDEELYRAFAERDSRYDGLFVAGVKTTGIFCRPVCPARKPKPENVEFFATATEAMARGYRPCRVCRPLEAPGEPPTWIAPVLREVDAHPERRVRDQELAERGLDPQRVRRYFKHRYGMTFHAYQRAVRLGEAFSRLRDGADVASVAFATGHGSLSGFCDAFSKTTGLPPSRGKAKQLVVTRRIPSPLGTLLAGATSNGICLLEFADEPRLEKQLDRLRRRLGTEILPGRSAHLTALEAQLRQYFAGERKAFDLSLVLSGTVFQEAVWRELLTIPYGTTRSYGEQARRLGRPSAVRAVARANGDNRVAIVVPCHRVIGKDGTLVGYGGGLWRKRYLLELERHAGFA
jgi:AraC family transcriptional regulator, regulatory protein of adaptative response / methylated-DNA-[protein]-cysteine methyltransferase